MKSFEFGYILILMDKTLEITEILCQALWYENKDIPNTL